MPVERTARKNRPSARGSRARVARQKRSARRGEIPVECGVMRAVMIMPKTKAGRKTILSGKVRQCLTTRKSGLAGGGDGFHIVYGITMRSSNDDQDGRKNHDGSKEGAKRERFSSKEPAEDESDNRIDESVSANARRSALLQNVEIRREAEAGAENGEIGHGHPGASRNGGKMEVAQLAGEETGDPESGAAAKALHGDAEHGRRRERAVLGIERAASPRERGKNEDPRADRVDSAGAAEMRRADEQKQAGKADDHARENAGGGLVASRAEPIQEDHP